jgi:hypothetical protein
MIIHASYFIVSKSDFVSRNLIWVQITFRSNSTHPVTRSRSQGNLVRGCSFFPVAEVGVVSDATFSANSVVRRTMVRILYVTRPPYVSL